jgi:hypothetical protein
MTTANRTCPAFTAKCKDHRVVALAIR